MINPSLVPYNENTIMFVDAVDKMAGCCRLSHITVTSSSPMHFSCHGQQKAGQQKDVKKG